MTSKQLANVLIKVLGLSVLAHNISPLLNASLILITSGQTTSNYAGRTIVHLDNSWLFLTSVITAFVGIFLIVKSRAISEYLFKAEDE
jgi:hypothetical protein